MRKAEPTGPAGPSLHHYILQNFNLSGLSVTHILQNSAEMPSTERRGYFDIQPAEIDLDYAVFPISPLSGEPLKIVVRQNEELVDLYCTCTKPKKRLCEHQIQVLYNINNRKDLRAFFDKKLRYEKIKPVAAEYGLENEQELDDYFALSYLSRELQIRPKMKELIPLSQAAVTAMQGQLASTPTLNIPSEDIQNPDRPLIAVIGQNKYYDHFYVELYQCAVTRDGKPKNPLAPYNPVDQIWQLEDGDSIKFFSAVAAFQNNFRKVQPESDIAGLKSVLKNPLHLDFFYHDTNVSENVTANALVPVKLEQSPVDLQLRVDEKLPFYQLYGELIIDGVHLDLEQVQLRFDYFVFYKNALYLIEDQDILKTVAFFRQHNQKIYIHQSKFEDFRQNLLVKIEHQVRIVYSFLKPATEQQREEQGFDTEMKRLIYLEDFGQHILIIPVVRYGKVEVPLFSDNDIYSVDSHGNPFMVMRDRNTEDRFQGVLVRQHPVFQEQLGKNFFFLHRTEFLDEDWFLRVFEEWRDSEIEILGFNKISKNRLNLNKAKVSVHVHSGINWFNTTIGVHFGKQKLTLKHLHKAVKNRTKYVELDDGTLGILPAQWMEKFTRFFDLGHISGELLLTSKTNFVEIAELYEAEMMSREVQEQIAFYRKNLEDFHQIKPVGVPAALHAHLRDYQHEGLNWLNFLDDFDFGGCLADDMGLGKTVQVIAFLLSQKEKRGKTTNLIIVPTSLIFNWQAEVEKFAPSLRVLTIYGADRVRDTQDFEQHDIVLTSYGTLLLDVNFLRKFQFNYIVLDESQAIKNPESQRYKAARLLQSRNRLVLTGTPVENNTFDLYGQLSFACPGLLGNKTQFRNHFSNPVDRFKDSDRARELQKRISPFILRRTKKQVATELPEKTEMVLYCEMGEEQRRVYNAYELEFFVYLNTNREVDISRDKLHVLQGLTKLRQICNSAALLNDDLYYGSASAKIDVLMEQIESKSPGHKILVFSQFVSMLELIKPGLEQRGIGYEYLTGQTRDRAASVENFQDNPDVRVFLISLKAGGTGLNLTEADYVFLVDPWWNPAVENQAIDRSYRIGQKKNVIAVRLICPDTIEEKMMDLQESKRDLANDLVKTDADMLKQLSREDLLSLVKR